MNTLYVFTDGSIQPIDKIYVGSPGYIIATIDSNEHVTILEHNEYIIPMSTNNNCEITAILIGIIQAHKYNCDKIVLFSDSKLCIQSLREWIFSWVPNNKNGILINSSGVPVANQYEILSIVNYILDNNINIEFLHQKGHVTTTSKSIQNAKRVFLESNKKYSDITDTLIMQLSILNNNVDLSTKSCIDRYFKTNEYTNIDTIVKYSNSINLDLSRYKKLINL